MAQTVTLDSALLKSKDTISKKNTLNLQKDTGVKKIILVDSLNKIKDTIKVGVTTITSLSYKQILQRNVFYNFFEPPIARIAIERKSSGKEIFFYIICTLVFFFACIRALFNKYLNNLVGLIFRSSVKQKQIREQLLQTPMPSLLLNIFFILIGGLYSYFIIKYYNLLQNIPFWILLFYCTATIAIIYMFKYIVLKFSGWIFNMREGANVYIFIVFMVNKVLSIFLLPIVTLLAFSTTYWHTVLITISYVLIACFFAYRYLISFSPVLKEVKVSQFHFFMYLCAFEIIPILLLYKIVLKFFVNINH